MSRGREAGGAACGGLLLKQELHGVGWRDPLPNMSSGIIVAAVSPKAPRPTSLPLTGFDCPPLTPSLIHTPLRKDLGARKTRGWGRPDLGKTPNHRGCEQVSAHTMPESPHPSAQDLGRPISASRVLTKGSWHELDQPFSPSVWAAAGQRSEVSCDLHSSQKPGAECGLPVPPSSPPLCSLPSSPSPTQCLPEHWPQGTELSLGKGQIINCIEKRSQSPLLSMRLFPRADRCLRVAAMEKTLPARSPCPMLPDSPPRHLLGGHGGCNLCASAREGVGHEQPSAGMLWLTSVSICFLGGGAWAQVTGWLSVCW